MNLKPVILYFFIIFLYACGTDDPKKFEQEDKNFYPISSFIKAELQLVDSLPLAVFKYTTKAEKSDIQLIAKPDFRKIAESFISPDITKEPLKKLYTESVFMDATINMVTFSYTTEDTTAEIRKIDIFITPETDKVKNIYVERISRGVDSSIMQKMIWTTGKQFSVSTIRSFKNLPEQTLQEKYVWDMNQ